MSTAKFNQWLNSDGTENYKCRAWVNFNGTGTVAIRAAGNVSSITDIGTGAYNVNFTNAMPDANYSVSTTARTVGDGGCSLMIPETLFTTTAFRFETRNAPQGTALDAAYAFVSVFR